MTYDTIIVGCGPAGMTAALYLTRAKKKVAIIEKEAIGGQMANSPHIENYPSFVGKGSDLADKMFDNIKDNVEFFLGEVISITFDKKYFVSVDGSVLMAKTIIWATGCEHIHLRVPGEDQDWIHYCITCDGPLYADKEIVIIGDGNSALQYAVEAMKYAKHTTLLTLTDKLFAEQSLQDKIIEAADNRVLDWIPYWKTKSFSINKDGFHEITGYNERAEQEYSMHIDGGVFIAIGQKPHNDVLSKIDGITIDDKGYILTDINGCAKEGIYAIGDCRAKEYRQIASAVGDGVNAALSCIKYLDK